MDHASFVIVTAKGLLAIADHVGHAGTLDFVPDRVTMNKVHSSHRAEFIDPRIPHVREGWGDETSPAMHLLGLSGLLVRNLATDTRRLVDEDAEQNGNPAFLFAAKGLRIGHLAHLHQISTEEHYAAVGPLDILLVPVDGAYTNYTNLAEITKRLGASVFVSMHWFSDATLEVFLADRSEQFNVIGVDGPEFIVSQTNLPANPTIPLLTPA